jgi:hypothetical protein
VNTRTRHSLSIDTIETLVSARNGSTWREYAEQLGYAKTYAATLNKAARGVPGAMTPVAENVLRERLGLEPRHYVTVAPCPDCGSAHTGRCHGRPVERVQIISGKPRKNRKRYHRPCLTDEEYARFLEWRQTCTNS